MATHSEANMSLYEIGQIAHLSRINADVVYEITQVFLP
jgi:hypothetical protein